MTIDQDQTVVDTDTARETAYTDTTGVTHIRGATEPIVVATPPTKEYIEQYNKENAEVTELCQNGKYH